MDFTPLRRHRDYRLLYTAQFITFLGSMVTYVALPYQMYQLTHSSLSVGLLGLAELGPLLLTAFVGGALADAVDRRRLVLLAETALGLGSGLLLATALFGARPWLLYVIAGLMSGLNGLQRPSIDALTPRLVDRDEIPATAALNALRGSSVMVAGPARWAARSSPPWACGRPTRSTSSPTCWPSPPSPSSAGCRRRSRRRSPPCAASCRASATRRAGRS